MTEQLHVTKKKDHEDRRPRRYQEDVETQSWDKRPRRDDRRPQRYHGRGAACYRSQEESNEQDSDHEDRRREDRRHQRYYEARYSQEDIDRPAVHNTCEKDEIRLFWGREYCSNNSEYMQQLISKLRDSLGGDF